MKNEFKNQFLKDGMITIDNIFNLEEVEELKKACLSPEDTEWKTSQKSIHSLEITCRSPLLYSLARDPRLLEVLTTLMGPDIQLQHSKLAAQPMQAGRGGFGWHQDFAFFPHTNTNLIAIMIHLDDHTPQNGGMSYLRGSHRLGLLNHINAEGMFTALCQEKSYWESHPENIIPLNLSPGSISVHHCLTLHGSGPNQNGKPRRGIVFQYRASDAFQLADKVFEDTGLQVCGLPSKVVRCEQGSFLLPKRSSGEDKYGSAWHQMGSFASQMNQLKNHEIQMS
jgi:ectoine hydroxylase-related dioxygenase (phytanoyl-CoA dioxygenase family)